MTMEEAIYYLVGGTESIFEKTDVADIQAAFVNKIQSYLPNNQVQWTSLTSVRTELAAHTEIAKNDFGEDAFVITLSNLYYPDADGEISCTRTITNSFVSLGITPRPGTPTLEAQIEAIKKAAGNRPIIVVDDTLFHGDTTGMLRAMGLGIVACVEFFADAKTVNRFQEEGVRVYSPNVLNTFVDMMPIHDFLPGTPLCGKLLGASPSNNGNGNHPRSLPYLSPFVDSELFEKWSGIPAAHAANFSLFSLEQSMTFAKRLAENGLVTIKEIHDSQPHHCSIPYLEGCLHDENTPLVEIIGSAINSIKE